MFETAADVLTGLRDAQSRVDAAEVDKLELAVAWAAMHSPDSLSAPADVLQRWHEQQVALAGPGAPTVAEFCVAELAAVLGLSTDSGRVLMGDAIELRYRLPRLHAVTIAGGVRVWKARLIAQSTRCLSLEAAAFADRHLAR